MATMTSTSATTSVSMDAAASSASISSVLASASSILASASSASASASSLMASATGGASAASGTERPASYRIVGIILAVTSGLFIGSSFVFKKKGLLSMQNKPGFVAGEGHAYLKSPMWWTGMILMIIGEICNFVAYAFTEAILVTPLGALSVVICAILSSIFLKEKLTFFGKIGCVLCIIGSVLIALNGPEQHTAATIKEFQKLFLSPGFLAFGSVIIVVSLGLIFWAGPRYGKKNMLVYISICSMIGGLSVVCTSGLGASILTSINGNNQFKYWFIYFVLVFVVITLLTEINYLNKALELFNTAMVTPIYFVLFTGCTLITDVILNKGFNAPAEKIVTVVFGFFVICCGITLLQMSKIDPKELENKVKLDRRDTMLLRAATTATRAPGPGSEDGENEKDRNLDLEDPGVDSVRGFVGLAGSIHRAVSARRTISRRRQSHLSSIHEDSPYIIDENGNVVMMEANDSRKRPHPPHLTTSGIGHGVTRHQLYDAPMPLDAADKISLYSKVTSPASENAPHGYGASMKSPTKINFSEQVTEHLYPKPGQSGTVIHQQHSLHDNSQATPERGVSEFGQHLHANSRQTPVRTNTSISNVTNSSILDAYSPNANRVLPADLPRPSPAHRADSNATATTAGSGRSTATAGSTIRADNDTRSLTQSIMDHFASETRHAALTSDSDSAAGQSSRHYREKQPKSPTARSFFSRHKHGRHGRGSDDDDDEEERAGLVGHGAEIAGSQRDNLQYAGRQRTFDSGRSSPERTSENEADDESMNSDSRDSTSSNTEVYQMQESMSTPRRRL